MKLCFKALTSSTAIALTAAGIAAPSATAATATPQSGGCYIKFTQQEAEYYKGGIDRFFTAAEVRDALNAKGEAAQRSREYAATLRSQLAKETNPAKKQELQREIVIAENDVVYRTNLDNLFQACSDSRTLSQNMMPAKPVPAQPTQSPFETWGSSMLNIVDQIVEFFAQLSNLPIFTQLREALSNLIPSR